MKNFVFIFILAIFAIVGCTSNEKKEVAVAKIDTVSTKSVETAFSNPAFIYGSDFMSFMQSLRKTGKYDMMVKFTASESVKKFGAEKIKAYYEEKFTNMSKLELKSVTDNANGSKVMNYVNLSVATKSATSVTVVIENDSCKLVLPTDLNKKLLN